jgi:NAD-specific glutamate dehydrogenase
MKIAKTIVDFACNDKEVCKTDVVEAWVAESGFVVERFDQFIKDLKSQPNFDLSVFVVILNRLKSLIS